MASLLGDQPNERKNKVIYTADQKKELSEELKRKEYDDEIKPIRVNYIKELMIHILRTEIPKLKGRADMKGRSIGIGKVTAKLAALAVKMMVQKWIETAVLLWAAENRFRKNSRKTLYQTDFDLALQSWGLPFGRSDKYDNSRLKLQIVDRVKEKVLIEELKGLNNNIVDEDVLTKKEEKEYKDNEYSRQAPTDKLLEKMTLEEWADKKVRWIFKTSKEYKSQTAQEKKSQKKASNTKAVSSTGGGLGSQEAVGLFANGCNRITIGNASLRSGGLGDDAINRDMGIPYGNIDTILKQSSVVRLRLSGPKYYSVDGERITDETEGAKRRKEKYGCYNRIRDGVRQMLTEVLLVALDRVKERVNFIKNDSWSDKSVNHNITVGDLLSAFREYGVTHKFAT
jgi:hypothetical protein